MNTELVFKRLFVPS